MNICVIPARGGSKRIPRKNIKLFAGKPMIAYAIEAALQSNLFERVVVSTDDADIATIATTYGAEVPFMRPADLADDYTATVPVIAHAIEALQHQGCVLDDVCCIYPCAPLIQGDDLRDALMLMTTQQADYCFPIAEFSAAIQRALRHLPDGTMQSFYPEYETKRTQDLEPAYFDAGMFYWGKAQAWLNNAHIHQSGVGLPIASWRVVDIDTEADWKRAEIIYEIVESKR